MAPQGGIYKSWGGGYRAFIHIYTAALLNSGKQWGKFGQSKKKKSARES